MSKFTDLYSSFDDFYETFYRGNEVEFLYKDEHYYVLPKFNLEKGITGIVIGKENGNRDVVCFSKNELYTASIAGLTFCSILDEIEIIWHNC